MGKFILKDRSYQFAIQVIKFCRVLQNQREYILSKQLIRSGTAIGAMVREAEFGQSRADFSHKLSIALKEANETDYWLSLIKECYQVDGKSGLPELQMECRQLIAILVSIVKKTKPT